MCAKSALGNSYEIRISLTEKEVNMNNKIIIETEKRLAVGTAKWNDGDRYVVHMTKQGGDNRRFICETENGEIVEVYPNHMRFTDGEFREFAFPIAGDFGEAVRESGMTSQEVADELGACRASVLMWMDGDEPRLEKHRMARDAFIEAHLGKEAE